MCSSITPALSHRTDRGLKVDEWDGRLTSISRDFIRLAAGPASHAKQKSGHIIIASVSDQNVRPAGDGLLRHQAAVRALTEGLRMELTPKISAAR